MCTFLVFRSPVYILIVPGSTDLTRLSLNDNSQRQAPNE